MRGQFNVESDEDYQNYKRGAECKNIYKLWVESRNRNLTRNKMECVINEYAQLQDISNAATYYSFHKRCEWNLANMVQ